MNMNSWTFNEAVYAVPSLSFLHFAFWKVKTCIIIANFIFKWDTRLNLCHIFMNHLYFVFLELHLYVLYSTFNWVLGLILSIPWNALCVCVCVCVSVCSVVSSSLWSSGLYALLSMGSSRQEYWSGLPFPPPEDLPNLGVKPGYPALQADSLPLSHWGSPECFDVFKISAFC